jgi:hypothetical protein
MNCGCEVRNAWTEVDQLVLLDVHVPPVAPGRPGAVAPPAGATRASAGALGYHNARRLSPVNTAFAGDLICSDSSLVRAGSSTQMRAAAGGTTARRGRKMHSLR